MKTLNQQITKTTIKRYIDYGTVMKPSDCGWHTPSGWVRISWPDFHMGRYKGIVLTVEQRMTGQRLFEKTPSLKSLIFLDTDLLKAWKKDNYEDIKNGIVEYKDLPVAYKLLIETPREEFSVGY